LAEELKKLGYKVLTADKFLESGNFDGINLMITETETQYTSRLISSGCIPAICYCCESPLVIPQYYHNLQTKAGKFKHSFLFKGAIGSNSSIFTKQHILYWTNSKNSINTDIPWEDRKFLTLINSNKYSSKICHISKVADIIIWLKIVLRYCLNWKAFHTFPGNIPDFYNTRIEALLYFSRNKNFDLYGQGWNNNIMGVSKKYQLLIQKSFRGKLPRGNSKKQEILKNYKFALCFENTEFPGYITEKIFDCILCGTIPIYLGAPDINEFIPKDVFIDFNQFETFDELEQYLVNMPVEESNGYMSAAHDFVNSSSYEKYYLSGWHKSILQALQEVIQGNKLKNN
jgi:hypothetical protein